MKTTDDLVVDLFVDAGMTAHQVGVLPGAARSFAAQLVAEGHGQALAEITAIFWSANAARLARRDRWDAHRAALDPGEKEPPPPPTKPADPPPQPDPQPQPTEPGT